MANISTAFGRVEISAPTARDIIEIIDIINANLGVVDYYTFISKDYNLLDRDDDGNCVATCSFSGSGRWAFACNIEYTGNWLNSELKRRGKAEDAEYLEGFTWGLMYDFTDYEPGCEVFGQGKAGIVHKAGQKLTKCEYVEGDWDELPFTYYCIMDAMGWSIDEILEERYATSVLEGENSIEEYEDDLMEFLRDYADYKCISKEEAQKEMCEQSEHFPELMKLIRGKQRRD